MANRTNSNNSGNRAGFGNANVNFQQGSFPHGPHHQSWHQLPASLQSQGSGPAYNHSNRNSSNVSSNNSPNFQQQRAHESPSRSGNSNNYSHNPAPQYATECKNLEVLDLGLDFKSYASFTDGGNRLLGNIVTIVGDKVAETFDPTVGLLVTILHLFTTAQTTAVKRSWLSTYQALQRIYASNKDHPADNIKFAVESIKLIDTSQADDRRLSEQLLALLDSQSEIRGAHAPSQRKIPRDPRGMLCNLHLADHKCHQEFSCNQLHLIQTDPIEHRVAFFRRLIDTLRQHNVSEQEITHRLKDCVFFCKYGNRVTVRGGRGWIQFFKTNYTKGRLAHALKTASPNDVCPGFHCTNGVNCAGIHFQEERGQPPYTKMMDLPNAAEISRELDFEVGKLLSSSSPNKPKVPAMSSQAIQSIVPSQIQSGDNSPNSIGSTDSSVSVGAARAYRASTHGNTKDDVFSPTTQAWATAVQQFKKAEPAAAVPQAEVSLLQSLNRSNTTHSESPLVSDGFTPLLGEINRTLYDTR